MSYFLCKSVQFGSRLRPSPPPSILGFLQNPNFSPHRCVSSSSNQPSFTVSYLTNSIGLSPQTALSVSKHVNLKTCEKPDKVVNLFKKYGFTQTQMSHLVRIRPKLLLADTEKTLLPKLEFLEAKGFSCLEIAKMLSIRPNVLGSSLDKQIKPAYDFLRNLLQSDKKVIAAAKRCPDILAHKKLSCLDILRGYGVPDANIATLVIYRPSFLMLSSDQSRKIVERVVEIGFDASKINFVLALNAFWSMSKSTWESKFDAYKKWGWSEEEVWEAFQRNPWCMMISEDKLMGSMDFFINQMGWRPCLMAKCPTILGLSLKKRVVPRCSVFQLLLSKGLVEKEVSINTLLLASEEKFLQKFVVRYEKKAPELLKMYKETLDLANGPQINDET